MTANSYEIDETEDFALNDNQITSKNIMADMLKNAKKGLFPKKEFKKDGKIFAYTSYLNFTKTETTNSERNEKITFICVFCGIKQIAILGKTSNIKHHLERQHKDNKDLMTWFGAYNKSTEQTNKTCIDNETLKIVKYFIASNTAASEFDSVYFRELLSSFKIKIPCSKTFSEVILKSVMDKLAVVINKKLEDSCSICLISDIWTSKQMLDFMGLAANLIDRNFEKSTIVIGMCLMPGKHNAENIKLAIENIINNFEFDKSIINGKRILYCYF